VREFAKDAAGQRDQLRAERSARAEPPLPGAQEWCVVAHRLDAAGFHAGAAEAWRAALAAEPGLPRAHLGLGRALLETGDADGAAAAFRSAEECNGLAAERGLEPLLDDPDEDTWYPLGLAEHMAGRLDAAVASYARSARAHPWFAEPVLETARAEMARGDRRAAAAAAAEAVRRTRHRPEFRADAERILAEAGGEEPTVS
jgi:tetratricopeptide (TPR) repeat protein